MPLRIDQVLSRREKVKAVLINAGQANAATGKQGYQDSLDSADAVAAALGIERDDVLLESTGDDDAGISSAWIHIAGRSRWGTTQLIRM